MKKKFFIGLFIFTAIGLFIFAHIVLQHNNNSAFAYEPQNNLQAPIEIPKGAVISDFTNWSDTEKPYVVLFYVDWCTYCRRFMPIFGEFTKKYKNKYNFVVINCDNPDNKKLVEEYHISGFPTLFISDKEINHTFSMNMSATADKSIMKEELDNYLKVKENIKNLH